MECWPPYFSIETFRKETRALLSLSEYSELVLVQSVTEEMLPVQREVHDLRFLLYIINMRNWQHDVCKTVLLDLYLYEHGFYRLFYVKGSS